jgi:hypothetical protein
MPLPVTRGCGPLRDIQNANYSDVAEFFNQTTKCSNLNG